MKTKELSLTNAARNKPIKLDCSDEEGLERSAGFGFVQFVFLLGTAAIFIPTADSELHFCLLVKGFDELTIRPKQTLATAIKPVNLVNQLSPESNKQVLMHRLVFASWWLSSRRTDLVNKLGCNFFESSFTVLVFEARTHTHTSYTNGRLVCDRTMQGNLSCPKATEIAEPCVWTERISKRYRRASSPEAL